MRKTHILQKQVIKKELRKRISEEPIFDRIIREGLLKMTWKLSLKREKGDSHTKKGENLIPGRGIACTKILRQTCI